MTMSDVKLSLKRGDRICKRNAMNSVLLRRIKSIYGICLNNGVDMPLIYALSEGYSHIALGFIECAKQTNTNLHTGEKGDIEVQKFLWLRNKLNQTAFNVAVENKRVDVAKLLLENASMERLMSERDQNGKVPISMLCDPKHDGIIISVLEAAKRANVDRQTSAPIQIVDIQEEAKVYSNIIMDVHSYPKFHKSETRTSLDKLDHGKLELTPNNNTILHLVSKYGDVEYVNDILKEHPSLLYSRNSEGETPSYVAAREGHMDILETMIHYFKMKNDDIESLVKRTIDNNTALHVAIQNHHVGVVFLLIKEIPQLANRINNSKESAVYLAAERSYHHILRLILDKCEQKAFEGPNGKTALHASAICGSTECIKHLLRANHDLLYIADNHRRTPLYYAVHHNNPSATKAVLNADTSLGYELTIEDDVTSSLVHIASTQGHSEILKVFISECPGCAEITNSKGRNILHVAIDKKNTEVIEYIFQDESLTYLINQKDNDGNTPIHLYMVSDELDMIEKVMDSRTDINVLNNENHTPLDVASTIKKRQRLLQAVEMGISIRNPCVPTPKKRKLTKEEIAEIDEDFMLVKDFLILVTLIVTASYAAAFTVPGGTAGNEGPKHGILIVLKKLAFQAFMVTNALAFACSGGALYAYICVVINRQRYNHLETDRTVENSIHPTVVESFSTAVGVINILTVGAIVTMAMAFATGIFVVLITPYLVLAFCLCFITPIIVYGCTLAVGSLVTILY